jgi:hypothetical protein
MCRSTDFGRIVPRQFERRMDEHPRPNRWRVCQESAEQQEINESPDAGEEERDDAAVQQTKVWLFGMVRRNERRFDIIAALPCYSERDRTHARRFSKRRASPSLRKKWFRNSQPNRGREADCLKKSRDLTVRTKSGQAWLSREFRE